MKKFTLLVTILMLGIQSYSQWTPQEINTNADLRNVFFLNENIGWIYGYNYEISQGIIFKTTDGGITWDSISGVPMGWTMEISFVDSLTGWGNLDWAWTYESDLYKSDDGGITWEMVVGGGIEYEFFNVNEGVLLDHNSPFPFYSTDDGGGSWNLIDTLKEELVENMGCLEFIDKDVGYVVEHLSAGQVNWESIVKTNDGGFTWEEKDCPFETFGLFFVDEENGYAQAAGSQDIGLYKTSNGADSWEKVYLDVPFAVFFTTPESGWLCSNSSIMYTSDGGSNWETQYSGTLDLWDIYFADSLNGWIVGDNGLLLHTNNGGTVGLDEIFNNHNKISVFPNPSTGITNIGFEFEQENEILLTIQNINGKEMKNIPLGIKKTGNYELNCSDFSQGMYFINLQTDSSILTEKLIIE
jgi:photosystem II stability/assembly factor-like uncharacterized protein